MSTDNHNHGFNAGYLLLALFGGAVAGAGVAYLTAPRSGAATRTRMRGMAHDANVAAHHMPDAIRKASEAARDAFIDALELEQEAEPVVAKSSRRAAKEAKAEQD